MFVQGVSAPEVGLSTVIARRAASIARNGHRMGVARVRGLQLPPVRPRQRRLPGVCAPGPVLDHPHDAACSRARPSRSPRPCTRWPSGQENCTLSEYIDWAVDQARRMSEIDMQVEGDTDDEKAMSLVRAMLEAGLAERL